MYRPPSLTMVSVLGVHQAPPIGVPSSRRYANSAGVDRVASVDAPFICQRHAWGDLRNVRPCRTKGLYALDPFLRSHLWVKRKLLATCLRILDCLLSGSYS